MNVNDFRDCVDLHDNSQLYSLDVNQLVKYYNDWGPSMRTCLDLFEDNPSVEVMEENASRAAWKFATTPELDEYDPADISNILFSIHPMDSSRENMTAMLATDHILDIVLDQVSWLDAVKQSQFFNMISGHPWLKSPLGNFYKKLLHVRLTTDHKVEPLLCKLQNGSPPSIPIVPNVVSVSGSSNLSEANQNAPPFYWQPVSQIFTSFDAIICTQTKIFLTPETQHQDKGFEFHPQQHPIPVLERTAMLHCIRHPRPRSRCPTKLEDVSRTRGLSGGESLLLCLPYRYIDFHIHAIE